MGMWLMKVDEEWMLVHLDVEEEIFPDLIDLIDK